MSTRAAFLGAALERIINKALAYDPGTRMALNELAGKTLAVHCTNPEARLYFAIQENSIAVHNHYEHECHCKLTGSLNALLTVAFKSSTSLANTDVYVEGNPGVLSQLLAILKALDIDWEEALEDHIGSMPAHFIGELVRHKGQWAKTQVQALPGYLKEYFTEELQIIPSRYEAEQFYQDINDVRAQAARLEARIAQQKAKL